MKDKDAKVFVLSMNNISKELEHYGDSNTDNINLLKLIYKYAKYFTKYSCLQKVDKIVNFLQRSDKRICMEYTYTKGYSGEYNYNVVDISDGSPLNTPPTIDDGFFVVDDTGNDFVLTANDLYGSFSDAESNLPGNMVIKTIPLNGGLYYNGNLISENYTISYDSEIEIVYKRSSDSSYSTFFTYTLFDSDPQVPLESNVSTMTLSVSEVVLENLPPTIGDLDIYADNRSTVTITLNDILYNADPSYLDPEGNQLDSIKIDRISSSNKGVYYYYGTEIQVGAIITFDDLVAGAFTYSSADINSIQTDIIEISIRDNVNMEWVSE